jgi:hypothetical protein
MKLIFFQSNVIMADFEDRDHVHLLTADIPSAFLDRFDFPALEPPAPVPVTIRHSTVPFKPYKPLYPRLLDLILPDWYVSTQNGNNDKENDPGELPETEPTPRQER